MDGVYTADPRVVPAARRIASLSYEETQELAESGAKVLNAQAVEFAKDKGIVLYARATASPPGAESAEGGTVVRRFPPRMPGAVVGVASERDVLVLEAGDDDAGAVLAALDEHGVAGKQVHQSGAGAVTLVISRENLHDEGRLRADLASRFGGRVRLVDDLGALSVVGAGINQSFENLRRGFDALAAAGATPRGVATSSFRITWMVPRATLDNSVRTLHRIFLEQPSPALP